MSQQHDAKVLLAGMQIPPNYGQAYMRVLSAVYPELAAALRRRAGAVFDGRSRIAAWAGMQQDNIRSQRFGPRGHARKRLGGSDPAPLTRCPPSPGSHRVPAGRARGDRSRSVRLAAGAARGELRALRCAAGIHQFGRDAHLRPSRLSVARVRRVPAKGSQACARRSCRGDAAESAAIASALCSASCAPGCSS